MRIQARKNRVVTHDQEDDLEAIVLQLKTKIEVLQQVIDIFKDIPDPAVTLQITTTQNEIRREIKQLQSRGINLIDIFARFGSALYKTQILQGKDYLDTLHSKQQSAQTIDLVNEDEYMVAYNRKVKPRFYGENYGVVHDDLAVDASVDGSESVGEIRSHHSGYSGMHDLFQALDAHEPVVEEPLIPAKKDDDSASDDDDADEEEEEEKGEPELSDTQRQQILFDELYHTINELLGADEPPDYIVRAIQFEATPGQALPYKLRLPEDLWDEFTPEDLESVNKILDQLADSRDVHEKNTLLAVLNKFNADAQLFFARWQKSREEYLMRKTLEKELANAPPLKPLTETELEQLSMTQQVSQGVTQTLAELNQQMLTEINGLIAQDRYDAASEILFTGFDNFTQSRQADYDKTKPYLSMKRAHGLALVLSEKTHRTDLVEALNRLDPAKKNAKVKQELLQIINELQ